MNKTMSLVFKIIQHKNISKKELNDICRLKNENWIYGLKSQLNWIENNIKEEDYHLIGYDNKLIAYANIVNRKIVFDNQVYFQVLGVGNVCISKKRQGTGLGLLLMDKINEFLLHKNRKGVLLCKDSLIKFYKNNNWVLLEKQQKTKVDMDEINVMGFNVNSNFGKVHMEGLDF